jgi:YbbR domain-containing protein
MNIRRAARRGFGFVFHDWPLKLGAVALAALLYVGLVATQDSTVYPGSIPVLALHVPSLTVVTNQLRQVDQIRYIAPADLGRLTADDFRATVDLTNVPATGSATSVRVNVEASDPRVTILDFRPRTIQVVLDQSITATVPVTVVRSAAPAGVDVGDTVYTPQQVQVLGPSTAVKRVVAVVVNVTLDPGGLDFDREVDGTPEDASGAPVTGVELLPRTIHVTIPLFTNKQSRSVPVNAVLTGTPAPGFKVSGIDVSPLVVSVEGDADQLAKLIEADTAPVAVFGATRDVTGIVTLALPSGIVPLGATTVTVTVHVTAVTETRTFIGGFRLDGQDPALIYAIPSGSVILTLFGSTADLDRIASAPIVVSIDVAGLSPGTHKVTVVPSLPSGVTVVTIAPASVTVTVTTPATPTPPTTASPPPPDASPSSSTNP